MSNVTLRPNYQKINGILFPASFSPTCVKEALNYKPEPDDVFIMTYPKCGTTWMQTVALYIFQKGKEINTRKDFLKMCPFIDCMGNEGINKMPRPGAFKTHLPYNHIPYSPYSKYVIVLRNPKDCCVSLYYLTKNIPGFGFWDGKFEDFFELFLAGEVNYNDYFDHLLSWYPHRNDKQVFYTTFEEMKQNLRDIVLKLAAFLGKEYIEAIEKDNNVLQNILHFSSFEYMKKHFDGLYDSSRVTDEDLNNPDMYEGLKNMALFARSLNPPYKKKLEFIRKGVVNDWRNHFSEEQSERLNRKFLEKTQGTEILEMYKHLM